MEMVDKQEQLSRQIIMTEDVAILMDCMHWKNQGHPPVCFALSYFIILWMQPKTPEAFILFSVFLFKMQTSLNLLESIVQ